MDKHITFELAKLLKEKGFNEKCSHYYIDNFMNFKHDNRLYKTALPSSIENENILQFVERSKQPHLCTAPTISQVLDWFYKTHSIWISVHLENCRGYLGFDFNFEFTYDHERTYLEQEIQLKKLGETVFDSPTEAYFASFDYILKNLI